MKGHQAPSKFLTPRTIGRSGSDLLVHGQPEQLDLFRETMTQSVRLQILAMFALSDHHHLDDAQHARIADIAEVMGYERSESSGRFHPELYRKIEESGMALYRKETILFIRTLTGKDAMGRLKTREEIVNIRLLQEFGFRYEDKDGQPMELNPRSFPDLIEYKGERGQPPIWALPVLDDDGRQVLNESGQPRRRQANGVIWRWSSRLAELTKDKNSAWVFFRDAVNILRKYLSKPSAFELIWMTLFWKGEGYIEISHDKLVRHLGIRAKDAKQIQKSIDTAFQVALDEGIIDALPTVDPAGKYPVKPSTNRPRRTSKTYRWKRARTWTVDSALAIEMANPEDSQKPEPDPENGKVIIG